MDGTLSPEQSKGNSRFLNLPKLSQVDSLTGQPCIPQMTWKEVLIQGGRMIEDMASLATFLLKVKDPEAD